MKYASQAKTELKSKRLTSGEASPLVAASEFNVEVSYQSMNVVIPFHLEAKGGRKGQVVYLHRVDVHLLMQKMGLMKKQGVT